MNEFYLARNEDGSLMLTTLSLKKGSDRWYSRDIKAFHEGFNVIWLDPSMYPNVKWKDEEPTVVDIVSENNKMLENLVFTYMKSRPVSSTLLIAEKLGMRHEYILSILYENMKSPFASTSVFGVSDNSIEASQDPVTDINSVLIDCDAKRSIMSFDLEFEDHIVHDVHLVYYQGFLSILGGAYNTNKYAHKFLEQYEYMTESYFENYFIGNDIDADVLKDNLKKLHGCKNVEVRIKYL